MRERVFPMLDKAGKVSQLIGFAEDVTADLSEHVKLARRLTMEQMVGYLATQFIQSSPSDFNQVINLALQEIGLAVMADRSYLFRFDAAADMMSNSHEWCNEWTVPQIDQLQGLPIDTFPG
ncbi:MAG: hypothetical protein R2873_34310 [Caldilineaceae bacterium]